MRPSTALLLLTTRCVAQDLGRSWLPAEEYNSLYPAAGAAWEARLDAALNASVHGFDARRTSAASAALVSRLMRPDLRNNAVFVINGKVFTTRRFLKFGEKNQGLCVTLHATQRRTGPLPNVGFAHLSGATGGDADHHFLKGEETTVPTTVIAKRNGWQQRGILVPNPYFGVRRTGTGGDLDAWQAEVTSLRKAAIRHPYHRRDRRAFWRGTCGNHECVNADDGTDRAVAAGTCKRLPPIARRRRLMPTEKRRRKTCAQENGNRARLLGAALTLQRPDLFDVKCSYLAPPSNFTCAQTEVGTHHRLELEEARRLVLLSPRAVKDSRWVEPEDYARYKYVLNLPGQTSGSYSRNLNHLWAVGAIVLLWDAKIVEWYYAALQAGITHLSVNASTAARVIDDLDPTTIERLIEGAKKVQDRLVCPDCIARYLRRVVDAIRERVSYRYVLDDRDAILALAERARACRDFVEVRVRVRRHGQKFRARGGASMCEVLRRGKWRGPPPPPVKVALDDSLGPRPAFAPRTGQFVVP